MNPPPLVLASTSRYRRALLERLRVPFECEAPGVDEDAFKGGSLSPEQLAATLAREKALAVARQARPANIPSGITVSVILMTALPLGCCRRGCASRCGKCNIRKLIPIAHNGADGPSSPFQG